MACTSSAIEITVVSAQGLRNSSSFPFYWKRLRPYATVALSMAAPYGIQVDGESCPAYSTKTDDRGGTDPRWNEKFRIPVDSGFLADARSSICMRVYARGGSQLGWCKVPVEDMVMLPPGKVTYLSYRLRDPRDGTRGHGIVNVAVKLDGLPENAGCSGLTGLPENAGWSGLTSSDTRGAVIGVPVRLPLSTGEFYLQHHRHTTNR